MQGQQKKSSETRKSWRFFAWGVGLSLFCFVACLERTLPVGFPCDQDHPCPEALGCFENVCLTEPPSSVPERPPEKPPTCQCKPTQYCSNGVCRARCGNGKCERLVGENCITCTADCGCEESTLCNPEGNCVIALSCGNGDCEFDKNEHCLSCPNDCPCKSPKVCQTNTCVKP